ncbi:MAG: helix-turn-helix domain-containing protein [Akkermansiaceae bacterium]
MLDALLAEGRLELSRDQFPVPQLTQSGAEVLYGREKFSINEDTREEPEKARRGRKNQASEIECHEGLFEYLRVLRKEVADEAEVPPYVVFSDRSLRSIAATMPESDDELLQLHGIGQNKCEKYGKAFLTAVADYLVENPDAIKEKRPIPAAPAPKPSSIKRGVSSTVQTTQEFLKKGMSIDAIAKQRDLTSSTIEGHIAKLIEEGEEVDWRKFVTDEQIKLCHELFAEHGTEALSPIIEAAGDKLGYGEAKIIRAQMELEARKDDGSL